MRTTLTASARPMLALTRILLASGSAALVSLVPALARAQSDVTVVLPNVMLLLDNSGSMEYLIQPASDGITEITPESSDPAAAGAACTPTGSGGTTSVMTRWAALVSVLTGSFQQGAFGCQTVSRSDPAFVAEYGLPPAGSNPYDFGYMLPWHRIYSNGCTIGALQPMKPDQDWTNWGPNPYDFHTYQGTSATNNSYGCNWTGQNNDGILDIFGGLARFGLMTLDTLPDPSTGSSLAPQTQIDGPGGAKGMWSYFHNWRSTVLPSSPAAPNGQPNINRPAAGNPDNCDAPAYIEVGARNASAPPWEGPMVPFGDWSTDSGIAQSNQQIQSEILSMRPFGATPIAGLLDDANEFLFGDTDLAYGQNGPKAIAFGPSGPNPDGTLGDQSWKAGCRKTFMILLTDGEPNLDLRGAGGNCDVTPGSAAKPPHCPYLPADQILTNLRTSPPMATQSVTTYVVGFALSKPAALAQVNAGYTSCSQLTAVDCASATLPAAVKPCCTLQKLATAGADPSDPVFLPGNDPVTGPHATPHAFFADSPGELKQVLATILTQGIGKRTSRTAPVYSPAGDPLAQGNLGAGRALSYHFSASFNVTSSATGANVTQGGGANGMWSGSLVRERYACISGVPTAQTLDSTKGDDFGHNLDNTSVSTRQLFTVIGRKDGNKINSDWTIRPNLTTDDGFGLSTPVPAPPSPALTSGSGFPTLMSNYPEAFGVANGNDPNCKSAFGVKNQPDTCVTYAVNWLIGGTNSALGSNPVTRDPTSSSTYCTDAPNRKCSKLGGIFHATPVVAGPPREFLRDDTYTAYANSAGVSTQPIVMYTATMDGQLHAFKVSSSTTADTPTVDTDQFNNEIWSFLPPAVLQHILPNYNTGGANLLDGSPVIADIPGLTAVGTQPPIFERTPGSAPQWHRVLVASGGAAGGFYYALDITDPYNPTFLWQISTDDDGNPLFGDVTPTPAITIVAIMENGVRTQVPVAILPGGSGQQIATCATAPDFPPTTGIVRNDPNNPSNPAGATYNLGSLSAPALRCWTSAADNTKGNKGLGNFHDGTSATGNSVTVVRIDTGEVLSHFTGTGYFGTIGGKVKGDPGDHGKHGKTKTTLANSAPMTGSPTVYPAQTGQVADRAYLGDADGQLWRLDLFDTDPDNWALNLAWDSYYDSSNTTVRDAIELQPVVSTDPVGNLVINFATGDQNLLTSQSSSNRVWSITETPAAHVTSQNWVVKLTPSQGHVTGPMALFNDVLYFSVYQPLSSVVCSNGVANIWGVDYRRPDPAKNPIGIPLPRFGSPPTLFGAGTNDGTVIFGVATTQLPSCGGTQTTTDPYFGSHTQVTGANQSEYRIMWQTGAGSGLSGGGVRSESGVKGMQNMTIPPPGQATRIDSWAAIVE